MKENIKKLQETLRKLNWKKNGETWYFENGPYCIMIGFQKSNFSAVYYFELSYVPVNEEKAYKYHSSFFKARIGPKGVKDGSYSPENLEQTTSLEEEFARITNLVKDIKNRNDIINFIMSEIIVPELGLNPRQKEQLELIP